MTRNALIVGIDKYPGAFLKGCINDADEIAGKLKKNWDDSTNFELTILKDVPTKATLKSEIVKLFSKPADIALFYFAGHGSVDAYGYHIVTPDAIPHDMGVSMSQILTIMNVSEANNKIIILDCCHAGGIDEMVKASNGMSVYLCNGVTILASSTALEKSHEVNGHGVFTSLLTEALAGGAADLNGNISPAGIYAFIDKVLGPGQQRPVFKTNSSQFVSLRQSKPQVPPEVMRNLPVFFADYDMIFPLDPSFEPTNAPGAPGAPRDILEPYADPVNVAKFKQLQNLQSVGLVVPVEREFMFFAAMGSTGCRLTPLGKYYWKLAKDKRF